MTAPDDPCGSRVVRRAADVGPATLLGVCTSLKPAPGLAGRSAVRSLLTFALNLLANTYREVAMLDLRDHPPPFFDGRMPQDCQDPHLQLVRCCVDRAGALLLSVPAYWSGVSGVFKNFVDVLCGPAYDMPGPIVTVFTNKPVGLLVVGADIASASVGSDHAQAILTAAGARLIGEPVVVADPRRGRTDPEFLSCELTLLVADLARRAFYPSAQEGG